MPVTSAITTERLRWPAEDGADRPGDVAGRERGRRHLVEQRLEQMVVVPVDQRDLGRRAGQGARHLEPAEAGAEDHHAKRPRPGSLLRHNAFSRPGQRR